MAAYTYGISSSKGGDIQSKIRKYFENKTKGLSSKGKKKENTIKRITGFT